jgi:hypothetical protein
LVLTLKKIWQKSWNSFGPHIKKNSI